MQTTDRARKPSRTRRLAFYNQVVLTVKRAGFTVFILDDHAPRVVDDTLWRHRCRAHETGCLQELLAAVEPLAPSSRSSSTRSRVAF